MTGKSRIGARIALFAAFAATGVVTLTTASALPDATSYTRLSGANEVPPHPTAAVGTAVVVVDLGTNTVCTSYNFSGLSAPATAGHIHKAPPGVAGPVVVPFTGVPNATAGGGQSCLVVAPALAADIAANPGSYYVNFHDSVYPGGEIRGQLRSSAPAPTPVS